MKVAVFCGSSSGNQPIYTKATEALGKYFAENGVEVVYGGGRTGLMGCIADTVMAHGGKVYGVIPQFLADKEIANTAITELTTVRDMHERKAQMAEMADAFVALPGGAGTLEEIFEVWTWAQLGQHQKPCAFYNVDGYYDHLLNMLEHMVAAEFLKPFYTQSLITTAEPAALLHAFNTYQAPQQKWT